MTRNLEVCLQHYDVAAKQGIYRQVWVREQHTCSMNGMRCACSIVMLVCLWWWGQQLRRSGRTASVQDQVTSCILQDVPAALLPNNQAGTSNQHVTLRVASCIIRNILSIGKTGRVLQQKYVSLMFAKFHLFIIKSTVQHSKQTKQWL